MKNKFLKTAIIGAILSASSLINMANAGVVILEGTDVLGAHQYQSGAADFGQDLFGGFLTLGDDVLVLASSFTPATVTTLGYNTNVVGSLSGVTLGDYDAMYVMSIGGCCSDPGALVSGFESSIVSYLMTGGSLVVQDYQGATNWTSILGFDGSADSFFGPHTNNVTATAEGLTWGFDAVVDSFGNTAHQSYNSSFFESQGYTSLLQNGDGNSVMLVKDLSNVVPEPSTLAIFALSLMGLASRRFKKS